MDIVRIDSPSEYLYFDISTSSRSRGIGFISVSLCNEIEDWRRIVLRRCFANEFVEAND